MKIYLYINSKQEGPYDTNQILDGIKNGAINYQTLCWQEGWKEWKPLSKIIPDPKDIEDKNTPEYFLEKQKYKTIWRRFWACLIDGLPLLIFAFIQPHWQSFPIVVTILVTFFYCRYIIEFQTKYGKTIGMWLLNIKVVQMNGSLIRTHQAIIRSSLILLTTIIPELARILAANAIGKEKYSAMTYLERISIADDYTILNGISTTLCILYFIGAAFALFNKKKRCAWDFVAGTVIEKELTHRKPFSTVFKK